MILSLMKQKKLKSIVKSVQNGEGLNRHVSL